MRASVQTKEIREAILDATDQLLARFGYQKMTIDDLAKEVGIGKGSVYLHFRSKEEIVLSHIDRIVDRLKNRLNKIVKSELKPDEKVLEMLLLRVLFRFDSVQHYTQSIDDLLSSLRSKVLERRETYFDQESEIFAKVLNEGVEKEIFQVIDVYSTAEAFILATNSLLPSSLSTQELGKRSDIEEKTERIAKILINGIMKL
jgi:AcrR family transcriptional regulator